MPQLQFRPPKAIGGGTLFDNTQYILLIICIVRSEHLLNLYWALKILPDLIFTLLLGIIKQAHV